MLKLSDLNPHFAAGDFDSIYYAEIAQSVEQRTENPRVGGSIPPLGTTLNTEIKPFQVNHLI